MIKKTHELYFLKGLFEVLDHKAFISYKEPLRSKTTRASYPMRIICTQKQHELDHFRSRPLKNFISYEDYLRAKTIITFLHGSFKVIDH